MLKRGGVIVELLDGWPADRIEAATSFLRARVPADVSTAKLQKEWVGELLVFREEDGELLATAFGGEHDFPIDLQEGAESSCALVVDQMQDGVIDRLGRPWPELLEATGTLVGVLDVAERDGIACWVLRGVPYCAVGQLGGAIPAAGHRLASGRGGRAGPAG
jgi:hypothetical protein